MSLADGMSWEKDYPNQEQEQTSRITHVTQVEGGDWITIPKEYNYHILVGRTLNEKMLKQQLGMKTIASLKTESGHCYDFLLKSWSHPAPAKARFAKAQIEVEDMLKQNPATKPSPIQEILEERGSRYGSFSGHALITQRLKAAMKDSPNWPTLTDSQKETLEMVAHKIGRILNGDPDYLDSWVDIVGYTQLIIDQLNGKNT